ncbi:MAG TPA: hypothetical protein DCP90_05970 [Clostridiales bacterium]|nr:MAG: hypothetical protein A2Y22_09330 [Clostridiales bacterium GWD2_32_59]HAN10140.1 hypothetical protein [Clostridiales bacterium]
MDFIGIVLLILKIIYIVVLSIIVFIFALLCIPVGFEVELIRDNKIDGHADILLLFGLVRFTSKIKESEIESAFKVLNKEIKINNEASNEDEVTQDSENTENVEKEKEYKKGNLIERYNSMKSYKYKKELKQEVIELIRRIVSVTKFKKAKGTYEIFISDPYKYGILSAIAALLISILPKDIKVLTAMGENDLKFNLFIKGHIIPVACLLYALLFLISKPVFGTVLKLIFRKEGSYGI